MIPISDDTPTRHPAIVNWALILVCAGVFGWEVWQAGAVDRVIEAYGFAPASLFGAHAHGLPLSLLTSMFLHGGLLHLGANMLYLWIFGNNVEDAMGHVKYLLFYLICGLAAALAFAVMAPDSHIPMVGASGAISGVLAASVLLYPRSQITVVVPLGIVFYPLEVSAVWVVGLWFVLQLLNVWLGDPGLPGIAWWAHVGGFAAGLVLTPFFKSRDVPLFGQRPNESGDRKTF
jgi:membrane associated rhomboid family serine protease